MIHSFEKAHEQIREGKVPPVILIGGDSEFAVDRAFRALRDSIVASDSTIRIEGFPEGADLGTILDSYRTHSLFGGRRLLVVPEINAFVTRKEIAQLREKAAADWISAKTDRKRASAIAKLLHALGLSGISTDESDQEIAVALGLQRPDAALSGMLSAARETGRRATRGEGDAALLTEAVAGGGAPGAILLMRAGAIPKDSATVALIAREGMVVGCDLSRSDVLSVLEEAIQTLAEEYGVRFDKRAISKLRERLGIDRVLADKFSKEIPDLRLVIAEAERLATLAGSAGRVTEALVEEQTSTVEGGARYELASLFSERKPIEALAKLRGLVAQGRREDPSMPRDMQYGRYLFVLADEVRMLLGVISFVRTRGADGTRGMDFNRFRDLLAEPLGDYLVANRLARQRLHPFVLFKKYEAARAYGETRLVEALVEIAEIDYKRKSGGGVAELAMEAFLLSTVNVSSHAKRP